MNPITQRSTTPGQQNGAGLQTKSNAQKPAPNLGPRRVDQNTQERMFHLLGSFMVSHATAPMLLVDNLIDQSVSQ